MRLTLDKIAWGAIGTLFMMTPLLASSLNTEARTDNTATYNWAYVEEASGLLNDIRVLSTQAAEGTDHLHFASRRNALEWRSHSLHLNEISTHINKMGEKLDRLQEIHSMIAPWQQKAVQRVMPNAVALADHTERAIAYLNKNQNVLWAPRYRDRVNAMSDHAREIRSTVASFLSYAKTSDRLKALELEIEYAGA